MEEMLLNILPWYVGVSVLMALIFSLDFIKSQNTTAGSNLRLFGFWALAFVAQLNIWTFFLCTAFVNDIPR
ncbi:MAG: hypothetical protein DCE86_05480 [Flavobacteriaceae bacterium]|nr:MAG: hypothetical protein DCE86_05480 [Flavobacteriaceae bacterium]